MAKATLSSCFARSKAALDNPRWAFSAVAGDGSIVLSCWDIYFLLKVSGQPLRYVDRLSRLAGGAGKNLLRQHLELARAGDLPIRLVVATAKPESAQHLDAGRDGSQVAKSFHARPDLVGRLAELDGDRFAVDFTSAG